ncbi:dienelactone hydrolase family protein [Hymenobacter sp. BT770]|uniref:alpha/beta hydrolase n=1 Tax=Hymenobacter sp. BT770 TaxID=2886942 RepID=UPI001D0FC32A|nr:alpha/beta fold hydrolase [Hymenobacter sp. BT770]MCC3152740.1 alpha/beta hydrolase [Hymenobacter sp. BT770]MDO3414813.1 dienelactone hydrolase family protein [Hymenobacter sp. BT770]
MAREQEQEVELTLESVTSHRTLDGVEELSLNTTDGHIEARLHAAPNGAPAVVWVGGAGGGLDGPAWGMYPRLAARLAAQEIASLRLDYRRPNQLEDCVMDTLIGTEYLALKCGYQSIALVGHSFGGAVVIAAGALTQTVTAVVAMSSQTYGTDLVPRLSPRPLLLVHGSADEILPDVCSRNIYERAKEPKELHLYPGCRHGLDECREQVDDVVVGWLVRQLAPNKVPQ